MNKCAKIKTFFQLIRQAKNSHSVYNPAKSEEGQNKREDNDSATTGDN